MPKDNGPPPPWPLARRLPLTMQRPPMTLRKLLPFPVAGPGYSVETGRPVEGRATLEVQPEFTFKPKGLMVWDAPPDAELLRFEIGNQPQVTAAMHPVPLRWFSMAQSFEQVAAAYELGKDPPAWVDFQIVYRGFLLRATVASPGFHSFAKMRFVMWGEALVD